MTTTQSFFHLILEYLEILKDLVLILSAGGTAVISYWSLRQARKGLENAEAALKVAEKSLLSPITSLLYTKRFEIRSRFINTLLEGRTLLAVVALGHEESVEPAIAVLDRIPLMAAQDICFIEEQGSILIKELIELTMQVRSKCKAGLIDHEDVKAFSDMTTDFIEQSRESLGIDPLGSEVETLLDALSETSR